MHEVFEAGKKAFEKFRGEITGGKSHGKKAGDASDLDKAFLAFSRCCNEQTVNGKFRQLILAFRKLGSLLLQRSLLHADAGLQEVIVRLQCSNSL